MGGGEPEGEAARAEGGLGGQDRKGVPDLGLKATQFEVDLEDGRLGESDA